MYIVNPPGKNLNIPYVTCESALLTIQETILNYGVILLFLIKVTL